MGLEVWHMNKNSWKGAVSVWTKRTPRRSLYLQRLMDQLGFQYSNSKIGILYVQWRILFFFFSFILFIWYTVTVFRHTRRGHYRWLWATMWLLGNELRTSGRAVSILNHWAISPQPLHRSLNLIVLNFIQVFIGNSLMCKNEICGHLFFFPKITSIYKSDNLWL